MEDGKIMKLFFERSEQAIVELSEKYGSRAKSVMYNILNNWADVEECINDAYLSVWNTIPPAQPNNLQAYFLKIAKNIAFNRVDYNSSKKRNSKYDMALDELQEILPSPENIEEKMLEHELVAAMNAFLGELPQKDRVAFVSRYWMGETIEDIAKRIGCSPKGLAVRLFRIRTKLKKYLEKERLI